MHRNKTWKKCKEYPVRIYTDGGAVRIVNCAEWCVCVRGGVLCIMSTTVTGSVRQRLYRPVFFIPQVRAVFTFWQRLRLALTLCFGSLGHYLAEFRPSYLVYWSHLCTEWSTAAICGLQQHYSREREEGGSNASKYCSYLSGFLHGFSYFFKNSFSLTFCFLFVHPINTNPKIIF